MKKKTKCYSGIGGQAVLEGIMMKNGSKYSVAVRRQDGSIALDVHEYEGILKGNIFTKIPFIRGVIAFIDSLVLGMRALNYSAEFFAEEEDAGESGFDKAMNKIFGKYAEKVLSTFAVILAVALALGVFVFLPYFVTGLFREYIRNSSFMAIIEGVLRIVIFVLYIVLISQMKDIKRVFMYHGAEHKCINCVEHGRPLTVTDVMRSSRFHKRCGTSFLLFVMLISVILFFFITTTNPFLRMLYRILLIPVVAGISYEILRLAGRSNNIFLNIISAPGLWLQRLTTKEPDETMAEVAIAAVEAVFDWKKYLNETFGYEIDESWLKDEDPSMEEEDDLSFITEEIHTEEIAQTLDESDPNK
ncbi:MAG: DUF1385 domain-containing protein [Lachnospiraceae bacterium]|nr:DUF1385 domain-containing protein [Lachnospiraceae bacterium]